MKHEVGVIVGSLRKDSYNRHIARILMEMAPSNLSMQFIEIAQLPLYNEDLEPNAPKEWLQFRDTVRAKSGLLFVTPEYNRSIPGALKNAIDVGSRPYGKSVWNNIPAAVISASPGAIGGFGANHHLRQCLVTLNVPCLQQPEMYLSGVHQLLNQDGKLTKEETQTFLQGFLNQFVSWLDKTAIHA